MGKAFRERAFEGLRMANADLLHDNHIGQPKSARPSQVPFHRPEHRSNTTCGLREPSSLDRRKAAHRAKVQGKMEWYPPVVRDNGRSESLPVEIDVDP
jgi:hypothetical protein